MALWLFLVCFVYFCVILLSVIKAHYTVEMGKRKRSVALIESDSDDDSNSGADIEAVIANAVFCCELEIENETVKQGHAKKMVKHKNRPGPAGAYKLCHGWFKRV